MSQQRAPRKNNGNGRGRGRGKRGDSPSPPKVEMPSRKSDKVDHDNDVSQEDILDALHKYKDDPNFQATVYAVIPRPNLTQDDLVAGLEYAFGQDDNDFNNRVIAILPDNLKAGPARKKGRQPKEPKEKKERPVNGRSYAMSQFKPRWHQEMKGVTGNKFLEDYKIYWDGLTEAQKQQFHQDAEEANVQKGFAPYEERQKKKAPPGGGRGRGRKPKVVEVPEQDESDDE